MLLKNLIKILYFKIKYGNSIKISPTASLWLGSSFEGINKIYHHTIFKGNLGLGSYISENCYIEGKIGRFCSIAPYVKVVTGIHPYTYPYVTTSPYFYSNQKQNGTSILKKSILQEFNYAEKNYPIVIGNDCWIGYGAKLISKIKIGNGAVVLANAVVTKDVPPYAIVGGIPAKIINYRYDTLTINFLEKFKWWDKDIDWLNKHKDLLVDINELKEYSKNHANI